MRLARLALIVLVASYAPLVAVGLLDPDANPIGLGLLSVAGAALAAGLLVVGAVRGLLRRLR